LSLVTITATRTLRPSAHRAIAAKAPVKVSKQGDVVVAEMKRLWEIFTHRPSGLTPDEDVDRVFLGITPVTQTGGNHMKLKQLKKENRRLRRKLKKVRLYARDLEIEVADIHEAWDITHDLLEEAWEELAALNEDPKENL